MYKITRTFIGLALMTVLLSSCQTRQPEEPVVLKVAYPSAKQFYVNFGYAFENRYPNIDVQVIPSDPVSEETGWNREADVIYINGMEQYKTAIEKGILKPISPRSPMDRNPATFLRLLRRFWKLRRITASIMLFRLLFIARRFIITRSYLMLIISHTRKTE